MSGHFLVNTFPVINVFAQVLSASDADAEEEGGFPSGGKAGGSALVNIDVTNGWRI